MPVPGSRPHDLPAHHGPGVPTLIACGVAACLVGLAIYTARRDAVKIEYVMRCVEGEAATPFEVRSRFVHEEDGVVRWSADGKGLHNSRGLMRPFACVRTQIITKVRP